MEAAVPLPVIASGGICTLDHVRRLIDAGTTGCIIGRALYEGSLDLSAVLALTRAAATGPGRRLL
jgi:phosphoribosylformimino-5-aminoimidazole carboxamide ribotide isomerase